MYGSIYGFVRGLLCVMCGGFVLVIGRWWWCGCCVLVWIYVCLGFLICSGLFVFCFLGCLVVWDFLVIGVGYFCFFFGGFDVLGVVLFLLVVRFDIFWGGGVFVWCDLFFFLLWFCVCFLFWLFVLYFFGGVVCFFMVVCFVVYVFLGSFF